ncbi:MAG: PucR family transcriptional regulator [Actinomycetes bacterium]
MPSRSTPPPPAGSLASAASGPTVAELLALDALRRGRPRVVAGSRGLGRTVRWTHVAEVLDIAHLLKGGELLLSTGVAFPTDEVELAQAVRALAAAGTSGMVVELGRRYETALPAALLSAADETDLPVIELRKEIPFVQVTEAVHALVVGAQLIELRASEEVHRTYTELSIEGADAAAIVRHTARMAGAPVVLENLNHQVLAFDPAGASADHLLDRWESRSRSVVSDRRTTVDEEQGWIGVVVGARGTDWGRLVVITDAAPTPRQLVVAERAAAALALDRLVERDQESLERQSHRTLLAAMVEQSMTSPELRLRAAGLGAPLEAQTLVGVIVRSESTSLTPLGAQAQVRQLAEVSERALRSTRSTGLVGVLDESSVGVLLVAPDQGRAERALAAMATKVRRDCAEAALPTTVIAAGSAVHDVIDVRRSILEAAQVADLADPKSSRSVHRLADVGLSGLLHLLRDDERVQTYVERELGALLAYDSTNGTDLLGALRTYLDTGRNKSNAAQQFGLSRPAFYERLHAVEALMSVDLDDVQTCLTLQVAIAALDVVRDSASNHAGRPGLS